MKKRTEPEVKVGQVWADNDRRQAGRTLRVDSIEQAQVPSRYVQGLQMADYAVCIVLTDKFGARPTPDRTLRIRVDRMKPTSTGYRLVSQSKE